MKLKGSEKQVAWAEDIIKAYKVKTKRVLELLNKKRSELTQDEKDEKNVLTSLLGVDDIKINNMKERRKAKKQAKTKEEEKSIYKEYADKFLKDVEDKFNEELKIDDAAYWIENHK